jgi:ketosteroid isomerase-like protein
VTGPRCHETVYSVGRRWHRGRTLVDTFSNLADQKEVQKILLFTEDATVESVTDAKPSSSLKGREQIAKAFAAYLANFATVYHINGQQTVELRGDTATGVSYSLVVSSGQLCPRAAGLSG